MSTKNNITQLILKNNFKIKKVYTTIFGKKELISIVLYDFDVNLCQNINKEYLEFLIDHIRCTPELNSYGIQSKNQHYLKQEVQDRWEKKIIIHNKKNNHIFSGFELLESKLFSTNKIGTSDHTFTYFDNDFIVYNENGIVTLIEKTICDYEKEKINNELSKLISTFCSGNLDERIKKIDDLSKKIGKYIISNKNHNQEVNIDNLLKKILNDKPKKIEIYKSEKDIFSLNNEWSTKINLEGLNWKSRNIIPISPKSAIIVADDKNVLNYIFSSFEKFEKENKLSIFLLLNAMLNEMERLYNLDEQNGQFISSYFKNTIIGIPDIESYNIIRDRLPIEDLVNNINKEDLEIIIYRILNLM